MGSYTLGKNRICLTDLEEPIGSSAMPSLSGPPVTPRQRVHFYSPDEWEEFIREWATALRPEYNQVKRMGGTNDHGVDVAGFKTDQGFEGPWDCYQGKHYNRALRESDAFPEILKVFKAVYDEYYTMPQRYAFIAPQNCGRSLEKLLSQPSQLRIKFIEWVEQKKGKAASLSENTQNGILELVKKTDFSCFQSVEVGYMIETHKKTRYHASRFGEPLPNRKPYDCHIPEKIKNHEERYVSQLIEIYKEKIPNEEFSPDNISSHSKYGSHFQRQRESFYSAEALRLYARDSVPEGTFEDLQEDIYSGVIETAEGPHQSGLERLSSVLTAAGQLDLQSHKLISVSYMTDRKGICHQLANKGRLIWVEKEI